MIDGLNLVICIWTYNSFLSNYAYEFDTVARQQVNFFYTLIPSTMLTLENRFWIWNHEILANYFLTELMHYNVKARTNKSFIGHFSRLIQLFPPKSIINIPIATQQNRGPRSANWALSFLPIPVRTKLTLDWDLWISIVCKWI